MLSSGDSHGAAVPRLRASGLDRAQPREPLVLVAAAIAGGISLDQCVGWSIGVQLAGALIFLTAWWMWRPSRRPRLAVAALLAALAFTAGARTSSYLHWVSRDDITGYATDRPRAVVCELERMGMPQRFQPTGAQPAWQAQPTVRFVARVKRVRLHRQWRRSAGRVLVIVHGAGHTASSWPSYSELRVWGELQRWPPARNPVRFSARDYWELKRIRCRLVVQSPNAVAAMSPSSGPRWREEVQETIGFLRGRIRRALTDHLADERLGLGLALLLGDRSQLSHEQQQVFRESGTAHLLAVSGMHVAFSLGWLLWMERLGWLRRRVAPWVISAAAIGYAGLVGGQAPVWRAATMLVVYSWSRAWYRHVGPRQLLATVAIAMWLIRPSCWLETGVQLSFTAVAVLCWCHEVLSNRPAMAPLERLIANSRPRAWRSWRFLQSWLLRASALSLAVVVWTTPLLIHAFGAASWMGVVLSPICALLTALSLWTGWLLVAVDVAGLDLCADLLGRIDSALLACMVALANLATDFAPPTIGVVSRRWVLAGGYIAFTTGWIAWRDQWRYRWGLAMGCVAVWPCFWGSPAQRDQAALECVFFAVGHGTCVWVQTPDGTNWLYDAGTMGDPNAKAQEIAQSLRNLGVARLDHVIVSHCDADHFNLLPALGVKMPIAHIWLTRQMLTRRDRQWEEVLSSLAARGISWQRLGLGAGERTSRFAWHVLHPPSMGVSEGHGRLSDNETSLVMAWFVDEACLLLPGDLEGAGLSVAWPHVSAAAGGRDMLLMAPHHGSRHSEPSLWLSHLTPCDVVISGSLRAAPTATENWSGPGQQRVWHTGFGAVRCRWDGRSWRVDQWDGRQWLPRSRERLP